MPRTTRAKPTTPQHPWYLREWMAHYGKKQADLIRDLDWQKATASRIVSGRQRYTQPIIDELAAWLNLRPYELLLPPEDAMAIRRMRSAASALVVETTPEPAKPPKADAA